MAKESNLEFFIGESVQVTFTIVTGKDIQLTTAVLSTATSLPVEPLKESLSNNDVILFPNSVRCTLDAVAQIGATSISIDAITGNIPNREIGQKIQNISSWLLLAARFKHQPGDADALVEILGLGDIAFVGDGTDGDAVFTLTKIQTKLFKPGLYVWDVWREDANNESALIYGAVNVLQAPSQLPT